MKIFLDKNETLSTCDEKNCNNCNVKGLLSCHFDLKLLLRFLIIAIPPFIIAGIGICRLNCLLLIPWIAFFLLYFGLIEIKVMCSHCPHYAEPGTKTLNCWANYGSPKIWKYRPGPMNLLEKIIFLLGIAIIATYPVVIIILSKQFVLLTIFVLYLIVGAYIVYRSMCIKCMNFACPFNGVCVETKEMFLEHNSVIRNACPMSKK
jgi:hypothetical protein